MIRSWSRSVLSRRSRRESSASAVAKKGREAVHQSDKNRVTGAHVNDAWKSMSICTARSTSASERESRNLSNVAASLLLSVSSSTSEVSSIELAAPSAAPLRARA